MPYLDTRWVNTFADHYERSWTSEESELLKICLSSIGLVVLGNGWKKACLSYLHYIASFAASNNPMELGLKDIVNGTQTEMTALGTSDVSISSLTVF